MSEKINRSSPGEEVLEDIAEEGSQFFNSGKVVADDASESSEFMPGPSNNIPGHFVLGQQTAEGAAAADSTQKTSRDRSARRASCIFCQELGHRVDSCPFLPCIHCTSMGHIGKNCLIVTLGRSRRNKGKATCVWCREKEEPNHRLYECPFRPCRYCGVMGHVGRACPIMTAKRVERKKKAEAWRNA